jgi:hypothetical protein
MKLTPAEALLSPEDHDLYRYSLTTNSKGYVFTGTRKLGERKVHRIIAGRMGLLSQQGSRLQIDHINQNKLDNRRENLRLVNGEVNMNNCQRALKGKGYKIQKGRFCAQIGINGKKVFLGLFSNEEEARKAYVAAKNKRLTELGLTDLLLTE